MTIRLPRVQAASWATGAALATAALAAGPAYGIMPPDRAPLLTVARGGDPGIEARAVELEFDLTPLASNAWTGNLTSTYHLVNDGEPRLLHLVTEPTMQAQLDGTALTVDNTDGAARLAVTLPRGEHVLQLRRVVPLHEASADLVGPYRARGAGLNPANLRDWGELGEVTLVVRAPTGWVATPAVDPTTAVHRSTLDMGVPGPGTIIAARPQFPYPALLALRAAVWAIFAGLLTWSGRAARALGRPGRLALGLGWGAAGVITYGIEALGVGHLVLGGAYLHHYGYWSIVCMPALALGAGAAAAGAFVWIAHQQT